VSVGECAYTRCFPPIQDYEKLNARLPLVHVDINIGLNIYAGHFSFMDGCMDEKFTIYDPTFEINLPNERW
jgi:hypothetical protein